MTLEENISAILECYFTGYKDEIIEAATKRIMEQIERQNPVEDIKQCGNCKFCVPSSSILDAGVGYCSKKTDEGIRVSLGSYCCDEYEKGETINEEVDTKQT